MPGSHDHLLHSSCTDFVSTSVIHWQNGTFGHWRQAGVQMHAPQNVHFITFRINAELMCPVSTKLLMVTGIWPYAEAQNSTKLRCKLANADWRADSWSCRGEHKSEFDKEWVSACSADGLWAPFCCLWRPAHHNTTSVQFTSIWHPSLTLWMGTVSLGMASRHRIYTSQLRAHSKDRTSAMRKPCICSVVRGRCLKHAHDASWGFGYHNDLNRSEGNGFEKHRMLPGHAGIVAFGSGATTAWKTLTTHSCKTCNMH